MIATITKMHGRWYQVDLDDGRSFTIRNDKSYKFYNLKTPQDFFKAFPHIKGDLINPGDSTSLIVGDFFGKPRKQSKDVRRAKRNLLDP